MSRVVIFCGPSGTGKTTLAREVSKRINLFCLHKDAMKERLYGFLEGSTLEDSRRIGYVAIRIILDLAEDAIKGGIDIMLEAPFNHEDNLERFRDWADSGVDVRVIVCSVDEIERERRHRMRPRHHSHHDEERVFATDTYDYSAMPDPKLFLDTDTSIESSVKTVLDFLRK